MQRRTLTNITRALNRGALARATGSRRCSARASRKRGARAERFIAHARVKVRRARAPVVKTRVPVRADAARSLARRDPLLDHQGPRDRVSIACPDIVMPVESTPASDACVNVAIMSLIEFRNRRAVRSGAPGFRCE